MLLILMLQTMTISNYIDKEEEQSTASSNKSVSFAIEEELPAAKPKTKRRSESPSPPILKKKSPKAVAKTTSKMSNSKQPNAYPKAKTTMDVEALTVLFDGTSLEGLPAIKGAGISAPMLWGK